MKISARIVGAMLLVLLVVISPALLFGALLALGNPPPACKVVRSPDGHEARLCYQAGFLGRDFTEVSLKAPGCCRHVVFAHSGPGAIEDTELLWRDNSHLQIRYSARAADPVKCETKSADVIIECVTTRN